MATGSSFLVDHSGTLEATLVDDGQIQVGLR